VKRLKFARKARRMVITEDGTCSCYYCHPRHEQVVVFPSSPGPGLRRFESVCVFITAVPIIKLFAWVEGDSGGYVLRETTSRGLCGLVCPVPSRTSERRGKSFTPSLSRSSLSWSSKIDTANVSSHPCRSTSPQSLRSTPLTSSTGYNGGGRAMVKLANFPP
jgi:hypothetical protein